MPFPIVWGIPKDTPQDVLSKLRKDIVAALVKANVPQKWTRPLFPSDLLDDPKEEADGANTIYVSLATGMLHGKPDTKAAGRRDSQASGASGLGCFWRQVRGRGFH